MAQAGPRVATTCAKMATEGGCGCGCGGGGREGGEGERVSTTFRMHKRFFTKVYF